MSAMQLQKNTLLICVDMGTETLLINIYNVEN